MSFNRVLGSTLLLRGFSFASIVSPQIRSATITGSVKDATGAVVVGADVMVTNQETNIVNNTNRGRYERTS